MLKLPSLRRAWPLGLAVACAFVAAQTAPVPALSASAPARSASAPARAASAPSRPASAPRNAPGTPAAADSQRIEITGGRNSDTEERRRSTASKIVIGREEIDKFGDATVGEVLRRLPGVTTPGAPGRGGPPRMRGLGNGYTQLLIDGERIPPGFSLESLTPEQIERIEILRAPTAETGARAIAGTINIITREGYRKRLNDLRVGFGVENGKVSPGINWTHNDSAGDLTYNISGSLFQPHRLSTNQTRTTVTDVDSGAVREDRTASSSTSESRYGLNLTTRLQWRLGEGGDMLSLMPSIFHTEGKSDTQFSQVQAVVRPCDPTLDSCAALRYDHGNTQSESRYTNARLGLQWKQRVGPVRVELGGSGGSFKSVNDNLRSEFNADGSPLRTLSDHSVVRENTVHLTFKGSGLAGGDAERGGEHALVSGGEIETSRRNESKISLINGVSQLADFGDDLQASSLRVAAYAQDEWTINPNWGAHAGLRWEGINTEGDTGDGSHPSNRSSVWTPLLHAVWKPDPKGRDQVRISLTRSYRSPGLGSLIARPSINRDADPSGSNSPSTPDNAGNPKLKPELATGVDIAIERYLDNGGVLSANVFHRAIKDLMRSRIALENVSWSPVPRWVRRPENIGNATTTGVELEAKFRLDQLIAEALPVELRANLAFFDSRVAAVPGPDNRLDQQAKATANFGGDYRLRSMPLTLGGNVNWVPGYTTRLDVGNLVTVSTKSIWDLYVLWTFSPTVGLRLLGSNLSKRDYANTTQLDAINTAVAGAPNERSTVRSVGPSYVNWQLRLEMKL